MGDPSSRMQPADQRVQMVRGMLDRNSAEIERALASRVPVELFLRVCITTYRSAGEAMLEADPRTFIGAVVEAAQLGLLPEGHLGEAYLIPVWDKNYIVGPNKRGARVVQMRIGYPGLMKIARRCGDVKDIQAECVFANDDFNVTLGTERRIHHVPWYVVGRQEPGAIIAAYATGEIVGSEQLAFQVVPKRDLDRIAKKSGNPKNDEPSNFWRDWPEPMSKKTAVRQLCKWLPIPDDARAAMNRDAAREVAGDVIDTTARDATAVRTLNDLIDQPDGNGAPPAIGEPDGPDTRPEPPPPEEEPS